MRRIAAAIEQQHDLIGRIGVERRLDIPAQTLAERADGESGRRFRSHIDDVYGRHGQIANAAAERKEPVIVQLDVAPAFKRGRRGS